MSRLTTDTLQGRTYHLVTPPDATALILVLHGSWSTGLGMAAITGWTPVAEQAGFAVCYPDAIGGKWNASQPGGVDDLGFLHDLIISLGFIRVLVCGMSGGAAMATAFTIAYPANVLALGTVCGGMSGQMLRWLGPPMLPMPIRAYYGAADPVWPIQGYPNAHWGEQLYGATDTAAVWNTVNDPAMTEIVTVDGGGHCWPGGLQYLPTSLIGETVSTPNATADLCAFFMRQLSPTQKDAS